MSHPSNALDLPELKEAHQLMRIPPEQDVPVTDRVRAVVDSTAMQRLRNISQLGLVSLVYPGAVHSRLEHSLGVFRLACVVIRQLAQTESDVINTLSQEHVKLFLLAGLLHDVGHWPYCHPIEDMQLPGMITHEQAARRWIEDDSLASIIRNQWHVEPSSVADFLSVRSEDSCLRLLQNILNGPVDIDKMDYLQRDSYHAGVPYGRNFDIARLISSLRFGNSQAMAITTKGKTAAEMMVFSRYVMFSEVYWHHGVRSATAMLQRAIYRMQDQLPFSKWSEMTEFEFQESMLTNAAKIPDVQPLCDGLFGPKRMLYKRCSQFNFSDSPEVHSQLAHRSHRDLVACAERLGQQLAMRYGLSIGPNDLLIDAPPVKLEIQFRLDVKTGNTLTPLAKVSPVVKALATDQFDNHVKMVRVFMAPHLREQLNIASSHLAELLLECS